jgi:hypothetical protein
MPPTSWIWQFSFALRHVCHWWQEPSESKIAAMTGLLLLLLIVAAIAFGLEAHHRHVRGQVPFAAGTADPDLLREQRDLRARP